MSIFKDWAIKYYEHGLIVLPVKPETKACEIKDWNLIFTKEMREETLDKYIESHGSWGIGLVCGRASNVVAADFDWEGEHHEIYENMILGVLPPSPVVKMGRKKWTRFYRNHESLKLKHIKWQKTERNFFDLIADGPGYTVLPPTIHSEGIAYKWLTEETLLDISSDELPEITDKEVAAIQDIASLDLSIIHEAAQRRSSRNDTLFGFVWRQSDVASGFEELVKKSIEFDLSQHRSDKKGPFFSDKKYAKGRSTQEFAEQEIRRWVNYKVKKKSEKGILWEVGADTDYPTRANGFYVEVPKKNGEGATHIPKYLDLANYLKNERNVKSNGAAIYIYDDGAYKSVNRNSLEEIILDLTKGHCSTTTHLNNFTKITLVKCNDELVQADAGGLLNLKNGILDLKTREVRPHTPEIFFKYKLPHEYNADAKCPKWLEFLDRVFEGNQGLVDLSQEVFGYLISGGSPWLHRAFILYGEGRNGKSVYLKILEELVGEQNVCGIPIDKLDRPFSTVMADGKLINICGEVTNKEIESSTFKAAVAGEKLIASQKGLPEYSLKFWAKLIFACNKKPFFRDATSGNLDRLCFIPFSRYIPENERVKNFEETLYPELPGILNWSLDGLKKLTERGQLVIPDAVARETEAYRIESDPVYAWIQTHVKWTGELGGSVGYVLTNYYENFREWCDSEYRQPVSKIEFSRRFASECRKRQGVILTYPHRQVRATGSIFIALKPLKHKQNSIFDFSKDNLSGEDEDLF